MDKTVLFINPVNFFLFLEKEIINLRDMKHPLFFVQFRSGPSSVCPCLIYVDVLTLKSRAKYNSMHAHNSKHVSPAQIKEALGTFFLGVLTALLYTTP